MALPDKRLKGLSAASLTDAVGRLYKHKAHILDLVSPTPGRILWGPCITIDYKPTRADVQDPAVHSFARLFYQACDGEPAGKVLVMGASGHNHWSVGGGTKLSRVHNHKMAGVLTDGRLRDFHELQEYDYATYCGGETVRAAGDILMPFSANVPVVVSDVTVMPGDYIFADRSGAVIIPAADVDEVLEEAHKVEAEDAGFIKTIKKEDPQEILRAGSAEK